MLIVHERSGPRSVSDLLQQKMEFEKDSYHKKIETVGRVRRTEDQKYIVGRNH